MMCPLGRKCRIKILGFFVSSTPPQFGCFSSIPAPVPLSSPLGRNLAELKHKSALILSRD